MKQSKAPTAAQKRFMSAEGYDPRVWRVVSWNKMEAVLRHKDTQEERIIHMYD